MQQLKGGDGFHEMNVAVAFADSCAEAGSASKIGSSLPFTYPLSLLEA
jgi:hypothetical protein